MCSCHHLVVSAQLVFIFFDQIPQLAFSHHPSSIPLMSPLCCPSLTGTKSHGIQNPKPFPLHFHKAGLFVHFEHGRPSMDGASPCELLWCQPSLWTLALQSWYQQLRSSIPFSRAYTLGRVLYLIQPFLGLGGEAYPSSSTSFAPFSVMQFKMATGPNTRRGFHPLGDVHGLKLILRGMFMD